MIVRFFNRLIKGFENFLISELDKQHEDFLEEERKYNPTKKEVRK